MSRERARKIVSNRLIAVCRLGIDDVPDTSQLCEIVDELEDLIESGSTRDEIRQFIIDSINEDNIEELIL